MELLAEPLPGLRLLRNRAHRDVRGSSTETYNRRSLAEMGIDVEFVQDNESVSAASGTIRGLHLQIAPNGQGKLIRVLSGAVFDVAVDVRPGSSTFGRWVGVELGAGDHQVFWIPDGFAHGFCTLTPDTVVAYKTTAFYAPEAERTVRFDDPELGIDWPIDPSAAVLSDSDAGAGTFATLTDELR